MISATSKFDFSDFQPLYKAFVKAFSDYYVNFAPTPEQFRNRILHKLHINQDQSLLAWKDDHVVGFVLHTLNDYQNLRTLYNGGTGVLPTERNQGIATSLYSEILDQLGSNNIADRILLEMLERNVAANSLYESLGFQFKRVLKCYRLHENISPGKREDLMIIKSPGLKPEYDKHQSFEPSFLDSSNQLKYNLDHEIILEAYQKDLLVGHLIFQPKLSRISQIGVLPKARNQGVGKQLIATAQNLAKKPELTLMNIPESAYESIAAIERLGFVNELDQFEMELIISN